MWGFFYGLQYRRSASRILLDNKAGVDTKTGQVPQDYVFLLRPVLFWQPDWTSIPSRPV